MALSTLPFKSRIPRLSIQLLAVALGAWLICVAYTFWLNPEMRFLKPAAHIKHVCAEKFTQAHRGKVWVDSEMGRGSAFSFLLPLQIE